MMFVLVHNRPNSRSYRSVNINHRDGTGAKFLGTGPFFYHLPCDVHLFMLNMGHTTFSIFDRSNVYYSRLRVLLFFFFVFCFFKGGTFCFGEKERWCQQMLR